MTFVWQENDTGNTNAEEQFKLADGGLIASSLQRFYVSFEVQLFRNNSVACAWLQCLV